MIHAKQEHEQLKFLINPTNVVKWLEKSFVSGGSARVFYHADADGCVSAAFWSKILSHFSFRISSEKLTTSQLGFEHATTVLKNENLDLAVFLDLPAGTQFKNWLSELPGKLSIFVYDHHRVYEEILNYPPRFIQYAAGRVNELPPTCVFSHDVYEACFDTAPNWLTTIGLIGEGQQQRFQKYLMTWEFARQVAQIISYGVLRADQIALEYLVNYLEMGTVPPDPTTDSRAEKLLETAREVKSEIQRAVSLVPREIDDRYIANIFQSKYEIANYVASDLKRDHPDSIIIIGQIVAKDLIRVEMRTGRNRKEDLRILINKIKEQGLIIGGGGHPSAVGARLHLNRWDEFVSSVKRHLSERIS